MKKVLICFVFLLLLFSCNKDNRWACFKSYGSDATAVIYPEAFTKVEAYSKLTVTVFQGSERKVEIIAGKHIIHNIKATVTDGILTLEDKNTCNFVRGYKHNIRINITVPYLEKVTNNGLGPITLDAGFVQDSLSIRAENSGDTYINGTYKAIVTSSHGNGDIYLNGTCEKLFVYANGTNFLQALNMTVLNYIFIANLSLGDCNINASGTRLVQYDISSIGNVNYKGTPGDINGIIRPGAKGKANQIE